MRGETNMKRTKRKARAKKPLSAKEQPTYAAFKKKLGILREEMLQTVQNKQEKDMVAADVGDEADIATQSIEKEMLFELSDNERVMLENVEAALRKIEKGGFGLCETCRKPIARERLKVMPFARYCIQCQNNLERAE